MLLSQPRSVSGPHIVHKGKHPRTRCCVCRAKMSPAGSSVMQRASELLHQAPVLPKVLVLDLDYTVWPYWCETYSPRDDPPAMYPEALAIIDACRQHNLTVAAASRTPTPHVAQAFMKKLGLDQRFDNIQLIPAADGFDAHSAQKDRCHLPNIKAATRHEYADMLFFDDETGNVHKVARLGVCSVLVPTRVGLCLQTFREGLERQNPKAV